MPELRRGGLGRYELGGRVVVVAGGSGGIGAACAREFAEAGATVAVGYHGGADRAERVRDSLPGTGHSTVRMPLEVSAELAEAARFVAGRHGGCDVLVNAAGITAAVPHSDLRALDDETFDRILRTNVRGSFALVREFSDLLRSGDRSGGDGVVVHISSVSGFTGLGSSIAYCASKAAMDVMTMSLARVLAPEVRVIAVAPAAVDTDFVPGRDTAAIERQAASTPLRVVAAPEDIALSVVGAVTHLRLATGTRIVVDGGRHL
ncbi:SDR family NAD(P)-dependent oxidoreductase [Actinomadura macra]|uniref:SDR family NAD(P)-dependent oxidoreductase n=1 Tax=Actinomadura macra TaxID=46164 RepID=UPI000830CCF5|nr:SDR family oxidoreductase [Actinomadura macra]